ncbi:MAG: biotin--[acetyl-CoA-carboxylase] ligase [Candidatus Kapabacteria bacterium]|nr:biotin--[acetyl-CoA-carboxylase] ligase [Candidatus Kapabacteria bacterium]
MEVEVAEFKCPWTADAHNCKTRNTRRGSKCTDSIGLHVMHHQTHKIADTKPKWRYSCKVQSTIIHQYKKIYNTNMSFSHRIHVDVVESTNDVARELLKDFSSVVITAHHQTKGRGRSGRVWEDEFGKSVLISFGIRHQRSRTSEDLAADMARGTLAVLNVIGDFLPHGTYRCKYPNDVHVREGDTWCKLAGTLVEHEFVGSQCTSTVIGIGVNILQQTFPDTITQSCTSMLRLGIALQPNAVVDSLISSMQQLNAMPAATIFRIWSSAIGIGRTRVSLVDEGGEWLAAGLESDGRMRIINTFDETTRIINDGDRIRYID